MARKQLPVRRLVEDAEVAPEDIRYDDPSTFELLAKLIADQAAEAERPEWAALGWGVAAYGLGCDCVLIGFGTRYTAIARLVPRRTVLAVWRCGCAGVGGWVRSPGARWRGWLGARR